MRVLVVDSQAQTRDGVCMDLVGAGVAEVADIATAAPLVLLLGDHSALRFIRELREQHTDVRVLVLSQAPDGPERDAGIRRLTARERDVLGCLAKAYDNHEIGAELGIAVRTVNRHLEAIRAKLGTRRRSHLVRLARTAHAS